MKVNSLYICSKCGTNGCMYESVHWSVHCSTCGFKIQNTDVYVRESFNDIDDFAESTNNIDDIDVIARLIDIMGIDMASISNSDREAPSLQKGQKEDSMCPICFIPLKRAFKGRGGLSYINCCGTMMCKSCADVVKDEQKKGHLKNTCIFGVLCTGQRGEKGISNTNNVTTSQN